MRDRSSRDTVKELFWRKDIARLATSGLTKSQFCKKEGLSVDVLRYWTNAISQRDEEGRLAGSLTAKMSDKTFLPLIVAEERGKADRVPGTRQMAVAEIVFAQGSVFLFNGVTTETVRALWLGIMEGVK